MSARRYGPLFLASAVGIAGGYYAFNQPLKQYAADHTLQSANKSGQSDGSGSPNANLKEGAQGSSSGTSSGGSSAPNSKASSSAGQSQPGPGKAEGGGLGDAAKKGNDNASASGPFSALRYGGSSSNDPTKPTVAGTTEAGRKGYSADHNPSLRSAADAKVHDGTSGGGMGVAEMRERKMAGQGLPSPQGGDTKAKPVQAVASSGEGGGLPKSALKASQDKYGGN